MTEIMQSSFHLIPARRAFLTRSGGAVLSATAIALLVGHRGNAAEQQRAGESTSNDVNILNSALAGEYEAAAAYLVAASSGLLQKPILKLAQQFEGQHSAHASLLLTTVQKLGGKPAEAKDTADYKFPTATMKNQTDVLRFAANLEKGAVSAYLGAVPQFADRDLAKAAASILGDEAMHLATWRHVLGENPAPEPFVS
jgi:rubrerythrin